jgi:hypothetical protein
MRTAARIFGIFLVIAGILYGAMAIYMLSNVNEVASILEMAKATEQKEFGFASIEDWKGGVRFNAWLYLTVGLAATVCGVGITAHREWARISWLVASTLLLSFVLFVVFQYAGAWIRYVELLTFTIPSFVVLRRKLESTENAI